MVGVRLELDGKVALITGGSRGIGAETVRLFREAGARVAFSYEKARERAEAVVAECGGPECCRAIQQELSSPADGRALVAAAVAAFGRLDVLVVNHGIWPSDDMPVSKMPDQQWRRTLAVNLDSVFGLVQAAVAQMEKQTPVAGASRGHIVLISSTAGQRGEAYHVDYAVTKGAVISLTKSLSSELAPKGIRGGWIQRCLPLRWTTRRWARRSGLGFRWAGWQRRARLRGRCCFYVRRWRDSSPAKC